MGGCKADGRGKFLFENAGIQTKLNAGQVTRLKKVGWKQNDDIIDFFIHSDGDRFFAYIENLQGKLTRTELGQKDLVNVLKAIDPSGTKAIRLLSCNNLDAAQNLSKALNNRPIIATDALVRVHSDGGITTIARANSNSTQWYKLEGGRKAEVSAPKKPYDRYKDDFVRMGFVSKAEIQQLVETLRRSIDDNYMTVYRVESNYNGRLSVTNSGDVTINSPETTLFLNFGVEERAVEYALGKILDGTEGVRVIAFDIDKTFFQNLSKIAKTEREIRKLSKADKALFPVIGDPKKTKKGTQLGLRQTHISNLETAIRSGSGREVQIN